MGRKKNVEKEEKSFAVVEEGEVIVKKLCERYPEILWTCQPDTIGVYGVENQEKSKSITTLAKIRKVNGVMAAVLEKHNINLKYIIELYFSDWQNWKTTTKNFVIFHELLHIGDPDSKGLRKHSIEDFRLTVDVLGVASYESDNVPNLLGDKKVEFNKVLIAQMMKSEDKPEDEVPTPPE